MMVVSKSKTHDRLLRLFGGLALGLALVACGERPRDVRESEEVGVPPAERPERETSIRRERTTPDERFQAMMYRGDVDQARSGFRELLRVGLDQLEVASARLGATPDRLIDVAVGCRRSSRTLRSWQIAEVLRRTRGSSTPAAVSEEIFAAAEKICVSCARMKKLGPPAGAGSQREVDAAIRVAGQAALGTVTFLRGTDLDARRAGLLARARQLRNAPDSLAAFDAEHEDLLAEFNLRVPDRSAPRVAAPSGPRPRRLGPENSEDEKLRTFVRHVYERLLAGDLATLKSVCATGYWPESELRKSTARLRGWKLIELGEVYAQEIGDGEVELRIENMVLQRASGSRTPSRDQLIVRREGDKLELSYMGSSDARAKASATDGSGDR